MSKALLIDSETGVIQRELSPGKYLIRDKKSDESHKRNKRLTQNIMEWDLTNFHKTNEPELILWLKHLSTHEKAFLFAVANYISYDDCHLQFGNGVDIGSEHLIEITGLSRRIVYETINSLMKKDIIYKGRNSKNRQYFVNPWLFCKGNRINKVLRTMFKNYKIKIMDDKCWKDLKN